MLVVAATDLCVQFISAITAFKRLAPCVGGLRLVAELDATHLGAGAPSPTAVGAANGAATLWKSVDDCFRRSAEAQLQGRVLPVLPDCVL
jgi:hypothetical protein